MQISVMSFGFKHGVPLDVDNVFDVRFLPNPHWIEELKPLTGLDEPVREYVLSQPDAVEFVGPDRRPARVPAARLTSRRESPTSRVAIGCTGGHHRSVALAEEMAGRIRAAGSSLVYHRDLKR